MGVALQRAVVVYQFDRQLAPAGLIHPDVVLISTS